MHYRKRMVAAVLSLSSISGVAHSQVTEESLPISPEQVVVRVEPVDTFSKQASHLSLNQWIRLSDDGSARGTVSANLNGAVTRQGAVRVSLVQGGVARYESVTDIDGDFMIGGVQPGVYSLVLTGQDQLAVCALTILQASEGKHLPDRVNIRTLNPATNRVGQLIRGNTMPSWTVGPNLTTDPMAEIRKSEDSSDVLIDSRGGVSGTLSRPNVRVDFSSTLVYLIRDGKDIARTRALSNGEFRFDGVAPGAYGLVASGPEGIGAIGFSAVAKEDVASTGRLTHTFVSVVRQGPLASVRSEFVSAQETLNLELAEPDAYVPAPSTPGEETVVAEGYPYAPAMFGGMNGGGMGGGGLGGLGASGTGGLGSLAALGALTAVAISAANGDQAAIVSPIKK